MIADRQTDRQTDRHACRNTPRSPIGGGLVIVTLVDPTVGGVALCMQLRAVQQSIGISCAPGPQPAAGLLLWAHAMAGTDGRTDGRTPYRYTDPAPHIMLAVPISWWPACTE